MAGRAASAAVSRRMAVGAVGGVAVGGMLGALGGVQPAEAGGDAALIGTWYVRFRSRSRESERLWFVLAGGILQEFDAPIIPDTSRGDPAGVEYRTVAGGAWQQVSATEYAFSLLRLDYDGRGGVIGTDRLSGTIVYDPATDGWRGTRRLVETDRTGAVTSSERPPFAGTRVGLEP